MVFSLKRNKGRGQRWSTRISPKSFFCKTCTQLPELQTNHMNRPLIILSVYTSKQSGLAHYSTVITFLSNCRLIHSCWSMESQLLEMQFPAHWSQPLPANSRQPLSPSCDLSKLLYRITVPKLWHKHCHNDWWAERTYSTCPLKEFLRSQSLDTWHCLASLACSPLHQCKIFFSEGWGTIHLHYKSEAYDSPSKK